jgi:predicted HTH domain antitoxin
MSTRIHLEMELPEGLIDETFEAELRQRFKEETALRLFQKGKLSSGFAARLIGISRLQFLSLLQQRGIPFVECTLQDFRDDTEAMEKFQREPAGNTDDR